ncbi:NAD(P)/FAD-dependent oxidoreductase [Hyphobacterium sp.]|uniref:NAD(P)/FAD-dependent oxidoreductase n=1 Tax=Hyphobacterium sp. TaxID=2004662 RepID=UPI003B517D36
MSREFDADTIVVGAGAVGLACAAALARSGCEVTLVEAATAIGTGISSRNSEVIHAGIYYPPGSLKAQLCIAGRRQVYDFLVDHNVPYRKCGKLVVATDEDQLPALKRIGKNASACGVQSLQWLTAAEARAMEPELHCIAALHSPETGILDSHGYMTALLAEFEAAGGVLALGNPVAAWREIDGGFVIRLADAAGTDIRCQRLILATGLSTVPYEGPSARFRHLTPPYRFAKGDYFAYAGPSPFRHHIYPLPARGGLGVHATVALDNRVKFGPDVTWLDLSDPSEIDFSIDPAKRHAFADVIREYWPGIEAGRLAPDYSGVRPKLHAEGEPAADFRILTASDHGFARLICLRGIESPGLTAALAIGEKVERVMAG